MRGKVCSVAAVTGLCQVSALPKAGSTKRSQDRTTIMAFECHQQQVAGNQDKAKAICEMSAPPALRQKDKLLRNILNGMWLACSLMLKPMVCFSMTNCRTVAVLSE